ncbi:MAG: (d)CMP kinase [Myxococcaceae bacterium]|nr:(d)CMP kinase [Myxococcaceae bacterium]
MSTPFVVAIDGPAGAGKSSVSKQLARNLDFALVDTGAIYRCVALAAREQGVPLDDDAELKRLLDTLTIAFEMSEEENHVFLDGRDVSQAIRTPENSLAASQVSSRPVVRAGLLGLQRRLGLSSPHGAILEGRDIGTVVFPDAQAKFFLEANPEIRARRRHRELLGKGVEKPFDEILAEQNRRDQDDREREVAPLKPAADAVVLDSSTMPLSQVVSTMENRIRQLMGTSKA